MQNNPLVSVILPSYNHAKYLPERIDSILSQDYGNFELIIIDDCSPDNSREVIERYRNDAHIAHIIFNEQNTGNTFCQWEKGLQLAKGEYVWIAESDDKADSTFLSKMMDKLVGEPDAVLAFSHSHIIDAESKEILPNVWDGRSKYRYGGVYESRFFCLTRMLYYNAPYNASMVVFRKKYVQGVSAEYKKYRHAGDYQFWLEMCMQGKVIEHPEPLNYFRQHNNKVSVRGHDEALLENAAIVNNAINMLHLSPYQKCCLKGKYIKRWKRAKEATRQQAREQYPNVYGGNSWCVFVYTIDKIFNFSKMQS